MVKQTTAILLACLLAGVGARAEASLRQTLPLDAPWRFSFAEGDDSWAAPTQDDRAWENVSLPHTWNAFDGQDGGNNYRRGTGWYRTRFQLPAGAKGRRVLVEFDAASKVADVFVNGHPVGSHTGAFARFRFDLTDVVNWHGENLLAVRVNNAPSQIIPCSADFTQFGGLYRPARLLLTAPVHIATLDYASPGVYLTQREVSAAEARVEARVKLANDAAEAFSGTLSVRVLDAAGNCVTEAKTNTQLDAGQKSEAGLRLTIPQPHLWNGVAAPYEYRAVVELASKERVIDAIEQPLGLRSFAVNAERGFVLNNRVLPLRGVCRHQDRAGQGWAISEAEQAQDFALIREMGANTVRLSHYQQDQSIYSLCDAGGLVVWAEAGFVNDTPPEGSAAWDNAKEQLRELIRQNYNHPSICFWSIGNETGRGAGQKTDAANNRLLAELAAEVRAEDPTRSSVYASDHSVSDARNFHTDALAFNKYFGWYSGDYSGLGAFLDRFHAEHPTVPVGISEYGAGASIYQHEENPPVRIRQARGPWHPEEGQSAYHEASWLQIKERPWLWGTFIWNMFDFASDGRAEGDALGRNDKGLVTYDRLTRKDAFYWYQANWTTQPMVHLVSKRFAERHQPKIEVKVYSNCEQVELKVNGLSLGKTNSPDCRFVWPQVVLEPGPNRVEAHAFRGGQEVAVDWCGWTYRADGDPLPNKPVAEQDAARKRAPGKEPVPAAGLKTAWEAPALAAPKDARLAGAWAAAQERNAHRMAAPPLDQTAFILDDVALRQHRKFAEYSGDISGRWIGAAAFLAPQFPRDFQALPEVMAGFAPCQHPDGHFGAPQQLPNLERRRDMPILWGNGRLLIGLVEMYEQAGNSNALVLARKLGDYFVNTDAVYDQPDNLRKVGGSFSDGFATCYFSCIEGLVGLARVTGSQPYLAEAERIATLALSMTNFDGFHSHGRLCAVRGFADLYALTHQPHWRQAAERDWTIFKEHYLLPTGGVKETLDPSCIRDEGCAEADWLRLNFALWRLTGEGRYLGAAERSLDNHFLYQQFANGGAGHRRLRQVQGQPVAFAGLSEEAWWCCGQHWARAMVDVARTAVAASPQALFINLAVDCDSTVEGPGGAWHVALRETPDGLNLRFQPPQPVAAEVCIHRPAWVQGGGVELPEGLRATADPDVWRVQGTWSGVQQLRVRLPRKLRVEAAGPESGVLLLGNDLLAACPCPANAWLTNSLPTVRPTVLWSETIEPHNGRLVLPASLAPNPDPGQANQWHALELVSLRSQAAIPDHQLAWFSFQPQAVAPESIAARLRDTEKPRKLP